MVNIEEPCMLGNKCYTAQKGREYWIRESGNCSTVVARLKHAILIRVISWLVLLGIMWIIWWWISYDAVLWLCWVWDTLFYNCTSIHNWLLLVESLRQLVTPKNQVTDRVSRINMWMLSNGSLLKYSRIVCDASELGQYLVNERCQ